MTRSFGSARDLLAGSVGIASMLAGAVLAFRLITPGVVDQLATTELFGVLGLLILPMVMFWTLAAERRAAIRARANGSSRPSAPLVHVEIKPMRCSGCQRAFVVEPESRLAAELDEGPRRVGAGAVLASPVPRAAGH
jgi:hypothetical protein